MWFRPLDKIRYPQLAWINHRNWICIFVQMKPKVIKPLSKLSHLIFSDTSKRVRILVSFKKSWHFSVFRPSEKGSTIYCLRLYNKSDFLSASKPWGIPNHFQTPYLLVGLFRSYIPVVLFLRPNCPLPTSKNIPAPRVF